MLVCWTGAYGTTLRIKGVKANQKVIHFHRLIIHDGVTVALLVRQTLEGVAGVAITPLNCY